MQTEIYFSWGTFGIRFKIKYNTFFLFCFIVKSIPDERKVYLQCFTFQHHPRQSIMLTEMLSAPLSQPQSNFVHYRNLMKYTLNSEAFFNALQLSKLGQ